VAEELSENTVILQKHKYPFMRIANYFWTKLIARYFIGNVTHDCINDTSLLEKRH